MDIDPLLKEQITQLTADLKTLNEKIKLLIEGLDLLRQASQANSQRLENLENKVFGGFKAKGYVPPV